MPIIQSTKTKKYFLTMKLELINKIIEHSAKIGIIGMGYVGLPLAISFSEEKFKVVGFDID